MTNKPLVDEFATAMDAITEERDRQDRTTSAGVEIEILPPTQENAVTLTNNAGELIFAIRQNGDFFTTGKDKEAAQRFANALRAEMPWLFPAHPEAQKGEPHPAPSSELLGDLERWVAEWDEGDLSTDGLVQHIEEAIARYKGPQ